MQIYVAVKVKLSANRTNLGGCFSCSSRTSTSRTVLVAVVPVVADTRLPQLIMPSLVRVVEQAVAVMRSDKVPVILGAHKFYQPRLKDLVENGGRFGGNEQRRVGRVDSLSLSQGKTY